MQNILIVLLLLINSIAIANDSPDRVLVGVKDSIIPLIDFSEEELNKLNPEFKDYYLKEVKPNLVMLYNRTRVIFTSMKNDKTQNEAILIGDTARLSAWGMRNFIAIAAKEKDLWLLKTFKAIDGTISCTNSAECYFAYYNLKIKPSTYDKFIKASLTYAQFGASGHTFYINLFGWNRYHNSYYIKEIASPIPLVPATIDY